ncbi:hypothetical protein AVEN_180581-1 [Araneus ventricosus]|uniref:Uncharacterized protein n=1 Tax=Araneus ventricosus TaxID=182803 RepID=A0A4Y1ZQC7_ARAVE|nr:hypothetical protein AVEN_180581-1 [Araneus ventricosus]
MEFSTSRILFLPFIPQPASDYNTIYTTLLCAFENETTFDQHLYTKAREIVVAAPEGSDLSKIVIRLEGFPLLSSFFGAFGYIMKGSGIKEVLSLIYAPNSLDKMLTVYAYARAVRAHTLLHLTLATIISKELVIDDDMDANLQNTIEDVKNNTISYTDIENCDEKTEALLYQCNKKLKQYEGRGSIGKLWIQYFHIVLIAKEFIRAQPSAAAYQHLCPVDYQVQLWLGNEQDPENWGWVCSNCQGKSYSNVESNTTDEDAYDINEEISDPSFFLKQSIEIQQQGEEEESEE